MEIAIMKAVLEENDNRADEIKGLLKEKGILLLNLISSPGSGKTTLLERTMEHFKDKYSIAVIEGDITTARDAERLEKYKIPLVVINTDGACHLNSMSIKNALDQFDLENLDIIFVENVGNLVCPSEFNIGENAKVAMLSTAEGDDKPAKYPLLFRESELMLLNKMDLIPYTNFNKESFYEDLEKINKELPVIETSCTKNEGLSGWFEWIEEKIIGGGICK
ncbi:MAG: hydrogenase nickel incorporation protein HypB [Spirochaetales bacterium]|nr:hydrogenase nickel incorporation protein HypB [Spirochaetales bacterium]